MTPRLNITILFITFVYSCSAQFTRGGRELNVVLNSIPCNAGTSGPDCTCPGKCLTYYNSTGGCHPNNCWKWDDVNDKCEVAGKDFVGPMVLQAIPFTGGFGSGWGNMGRWDIFNIYIWPLYLDRWRLLFLVVVARWVDFVLRMKTDWSVGVVLVIVLVVCGQWLLLRCGFGELLLFAKKPLAPWTDWEGNAIECVLVS